MSDLPSQQPGMEGNPGDYSDADYFIEGLNKRRDATEQTEREIGFIAVNLPDSTLAKIPKPVETAVSEKGGVDSVIEDGRQSFEDKRKEYQRQLDKVAEVRAYQPPSLKTRWLRSLGRIAKGQLH